MSALNFARAIINRGHRVTRVFFYSDGVYIANAMGSPPQDEPNLMESWATLAEANDIDLDVCIGASLRRGIMDAAEAKRYAKQGDNLHPGFELAGLGQLVDASLTSDRLITFSG
ncbi:MAG: tRNA 2-thiouridine synthesizing protein D [Halieaceae bacterium]|jgi:tRNA 2-thiouridine synthesizing protein D